MQERNCQNAKCGKPLGKRQDKYCSRACQREGRRSPKADQVWALRLARPELEVREIAQIVGVSHKYADGVLYRYASRPEGLLKRGKYKPRKAEPPPPEPEPEPPPPAKVYPPLPPGKYGKHVAPGWLWQGGEKLEKEYEHLWKKK